MNDTTPSVSEQEKPNEFARENKPVGFIETELPNVYVGFSANRDILAFEFVFNDKKHTIWLGMTFGLAVIERDEDYAEIFRGNLNDTHEPTRGGLPTDDRGSAERPGTGC